MQIGTSFPCPSGKPKNAVSWRHVWIGTSTADGRASAAAQAPATSTTTAREPTAIRLDPDHRSPSTATVSTRSPGRSAAPSPRAASRKPGRRPGRIGVARRGSHAAAPMSSTTRAGDQPGDLVALGDPRVDPDRLQDRDVGPQRLDQLVRHDMQEPVRTNAQSRAPTSSGQMLEVRERRPTQAGVALEGRSGMRTKPELRPVAPASTAERSRTTTWDAAPREGEKRQLTRPGHRLPTR
jgi:hypothetical protein